MNQLTTVGIDLAKDVFAVCVLDVTGAVIERRVLRRDAFIKWAERLSTCRVAMEACGSAHHWGRWFSARGQRSARGRTSLGRFRADRRHLPFLV